MQEENLNFEIVLTGTFWDKRPQFSVWLDDLKIVKDEITSEDEKIVRFEHRINEGPHELKIRLENKNMADTILENGQIVKDMLLNIIDIKVDDISLGNLLWTAEYKLDEAQNLNGEIIDHLDNCVNLGWNGTYKLKISSPFYIWLLEKL